MKGVSAIAGLLLVLAVAAVLVADPAVAKPVVANPESAQTPACDEMKKMVATCVKYVTEKEDKPSAECCQGAQRLHAATTTTEARRSACYCLKEAALKVKDIKDERVSSVPGECSVNLSFRLSTKIDCGTIP